MTEGEKTLVRDMVADPSDPEEWAKTANRLCRNEEWKLAAYAYGEAKRLEMIRQVQRKTACLENVIRWREAARRCSENSRLPAEGW